MNEKETFATVAISQDTMQADAQGEEWTGDPPMDGHMMADEGPMDDRWRADLWPTDSRQQATTVPIT